jgi:hypothetical protein
VRDTTGEDAETGEEDVGTAQMLDFNRAVCFLLLLPGTLFVQLLTQKDIEVLFCFITFPIEQSYIALLPVALVALLCAALDVSCNKAHGSPSLVNLGAKPNDSVTALTNSRDTFSGIDELMLSSTRDPVRIESDNPPNCPSNGRPSAGQTRKIIQVLIRRQ